MVLPPMAFVSKKKSHYTSFSDTESHLITCNINSINTKFCHVQTQIMTHLPYILQSIFGFEKGDTEYRSQEQIITIDFQFGFLFSSRH